jgi:hypothetical protein
MENKDSAYQSRDLISLHTIPDIESISLANFKLNLDFDKFNRVLVKEHNFHSIEKILNDMKKRFHTPQQVSLF